MKLYISVTSPYARKAQIVRAEKGLEDRVTLVAVNAMQDDVFALTGNPLAKIPVLILEDGTTLFDSPVICAYLDRLVPAPALIPPSGPERWRVEQAQALADGILDAAFATVMERKRDQAQQSEMWLGRWQRAIDRGLQAMAEDLAQGPGAFDLGRIAYASVLGYLDLRFREYPWRAQYPVLADWFKEVSTRESVAQSAPPVS